MTDETTSVETSIETPAPTDQTPDTPATAEGEPSTSESTPTDDGSLFSGEPETQTEQKTDDEETKLFAGKFETAEDLENDWKRLNDQVRGRAPAAYDITTMEVAGFEVSDQEAWDNTVSNLKENGFTQNQLNYMFELAGQMNEQFKTAYQQYTGPQPDAAKEMDALKSHWGDTYQEKGNQITTWAKQNLEADVFGPLTKTAAGMKYLEQQMSNTMINPIQNNEAPDPGPTMQKVKDLIRDPNYSRDEHLQNQAYNMLKQLQK